MDDATKKSITEMFSGNVSLSTVILQLLVAKGVLTPDEVLNALEGNEENAAPSGSDAAFRQARRLFLSLQSKPPFPLP